MSSTSSENISPSAMGPPMSSSIGIADAAAVEQWRWPMAGAVTLLGILVFVYWDFFSFQVNEAIVEQADWGHILVAPFIAGYFIYRNRKTVLSHPFRTTWFGLVPIILGFGIYVFGSIGASRHHNVQSVGVIATLGGLGLLFCGWRSVSWLWFPLLYLALFGQVISERFMKNITHEMQDITAIGSHLFMQLIGMDVDRQGNTISISHNGEIKPLNIAEACSGMRMLMAFLALGVIMAYTGLKRFWQRAALVIVAIPTAIFVNVLRVATLGILSLFDSGFAAGDFHSFIGLVWLVPAFFVFLGFIWVITHLVIEENSDAVAVNVSRAAPAGPTQRGGAL